MAQTVTQRFVSFPPKLAGGVKLSAELLDQRHAHLTLTHGEHQAEIIATALSVPYPSGLRRLLASERDVQGILVERISPGLDEAAQDRNISILDIHGRGRVVGPGFVYVSSPTSTDSPLGLPTVAALASRSSPFAPKASRIVRALLADHSHPRRLSDVADVVNMNTGNVHRILSSLQGLELVERHGDLYEVPDPGSLLEAWADASKPPREQFAISVGETAAGDLVGEVTRPLRGRAAVSGEVAAELLAPHLAARSAIVHVWEADLFATLAREWRQPRDPFNRAIVRVDLADEQIGRFGSERSGIALVSPAQLYVDMQRGRGRSRAAAEELRRQVLGY